MATTKHQHDGTWAGKMRAQLCIPRSPHSPMRPLEVLWYEMSWHWSNSAGVHTGVLPSVPVGMGSFPAWSCRSTRLNE
jgi:hypothetical protein